MKMKTLDDLLAHELKDLYSAEKQIAKALPKMIKAVSDDTLHSALESHWHETDEQISRLDEICEKLGVNTRGAKCVAMEGIINEGKEFLEDGMDDHVRDAAIIAAAQRVEHYEIAGYGCARTFAEKLGHSDVAQMLQRSLDEEKAADEKLTRIATQAVNEEALAGSH
jgi:ferritin-like metal-binding protein YciE